MINWEIAGNWYNWVAIGLMFLVVFGLVSIVRKNIGGLS